MGQIDPYCPKCGNGRIVIDTVHDEWGAHGLACLFVASEETIMFSAECAECDWSLEKKLLTESVE
jgi:hypothetical protein